MQLSQKLTNLMEQHDVSAYKMSKDTGISDRLIGYWKKGDKLPSAENLIIIAKYFSTSIDYLLGLNDTSSSLIPLKEKQLALNEEERNLVCNFNMLNETAKSSLKEYLNFMISQPKNLKNSSEINQMNA